MLTAVQSFNCSVSRRSLLAGLAAAGLAAGCSSGASSGSGAGGNGFPRTVEHDSGRTEIPAVPQRVVSALDYDDLDAVLAVGVTPVAFGFSSWLVPDLTPWAGGAGRSTRLDGEVATISLEKVAAQRPDLIVAQTDLLAGNYPKLSAIAPTVTVAVRGGDWRHGTTVVGQATGREAQAAAAIDRAETELDRNRRALAGVRGARVAIINRFSGGIRVDSIDDGIASGGVLLRDLGLVPVDGGVDPTSRTLSDEAVSRFADVDAIIVQDFGSETEQLFALPVFERLRPVRERRVARLSQAATRATYLLSSLAVPYAAREITAALLAARAGRGSTAPVPSGR